ncbi:MAG: PAS domain-containing protein [Thermodesulfobacteriota bacterium]
MKPSYAQLKEQIQELKNVESELIKTTEALRKNESRFRLLYERAPVGYQSLDIEGNFIEVNQAWLDTLGYEKTEVIGKNFADFLPPEWVDHFKQRFPVFKAVGEIFGVEFEMVKKNESIILVSFNGKIGKDASDNFQQTHCVLYDITEERKKEAALKESEKRFRSIVENSEIKILRGILPICSICKKIRNDKGYWTQLEEYINDHSEADFSHGICPECAKKYYPDMNLYGNDGNQG